MNIYELKKWTEEIYAKSNNELLKDGLEEKNISKVRSLLKQGIRDRCSIIIKNSEKNSKFEKDIKKFLIQLESYKIIPPKPEEASVSNEENKSSL
jgi:hypothetical protein